MPHGKSPAELNKDLNRLLNIPRDKSNSPIYKTREEDTETGGHFQSCSYGKAVTASIGWEDLQTISFPFPVSLLSASAFIKAACDLDEVEFQIAPLTNIGAISADEAAGQTVLSVVQSVIDNIDVGYHVTLDDGVNADDCGRVISVDKDNLTVTCETATTNAFTATGTIGYIKITVKMAPLIELIDGELLDVGKSKIGGSYLPANKSMVVRYHNVDGAAKRFTFRLEYLY